MAGVMVLLEHSGDFLGTRFQGQPLRLELERLLREPGDIHLDFEGVNITQSCADEFLGTLIAEHGEELLSRLHFKKCSTAVRAILELVIGGRLRDNENLKRVGNAQGRLPAAHAY
jgi:hypothetical protein